MNYYLEVIKITDTTKIDNLNRENSGTKNENEVSEVKKPTTSFSKNHSVDSRAVVIQAKTDCFGQNILVVLDCSTNKQLTDVFGSRR